MIGAQDFRGKVVVVTGASRGIGARLAASYAEAGAKVVFGARRPDVLKGLEAKIRGAGFEATAVACDVASSADCEALVGRAIADHGTIDILVNNAGISGVQKPTWEIQDSEMEEVLRVNVYGALACIRAAAPTMIERRSGAIVNIGSFTGKRPAVNRLVYATSKMALLGLSRTVALELAPHQVRCNVVSPGPVEGERVQEVIARASSANQISPDEVRQQFLSWSPMREIASEEEICEAVFYLTSSGARHVTGQDLNVDGGIVMF